MERLERSKLDNALNVIRDAPKGYFETRYTHKGDYEVVYISSQSGCNQGCRFCHLTATGQTKSGNASASELIRQACIGLEKCVGSKTNIVHFNYMARGEPLLNPALNSDSMLDISRVVARDGYKARHLVSTIIPKAFARTYELSDRFATLQPEIYWSLYTVDPAKRKLFMPNAARLSSSVTILLNWQHYSRKIPKVHFSLVPGLNDSPAEIESLCNFLASSGLRVDFNLVEYNPPDAKTFPRMTTENAASIIRTAIPDAKVSVVPRIGPDAHVSCGMFFTE